MNKVSSTDLLKTIMKKFPHCKFSISSSHMDDQDPEEIWTVPVPLTKERFKNLTEDSSVKKLYIMVHYNLES